VADHAPAIQCGTSPMALRHCGVDKVGHEERGSMMMMTMMMMKVMMMLMLMMMMMMVMI